MLRKLVVVFTSVVLFAAAHAKALGLGEIVLESSLNQPLDARIALQQLGNVRPEQIQVRMAGEDDFARFSVQRVAFLDSVRFDVQSSGPDAVVRLRTDEAVREPYLNFVVETRWPSGRLLSEYTVLLDLPPFTATGNAAPVQQPTQAPAPVKSLQNQQIGQISSSAPERLAAAPASEPEPVAVPAEEPAPSVAAEPPAAPEPETQPARAASATAESITIGSNDTLWDVALRVRPDSSVSVQQTMLALQSLNREAFISDNINMVRRGQVLRVPTLEQIRALSAREAMSEVARQNQLFDNRRNVPLSSQPVTAQPQATGGPGRGELTVVSSDAADSGSAQAPGTGQNPDQSAALDAQIASLEDALAVQREEADRAALLNAELTERLGLLEQQIASAQEIIRLRDLELAQLQQSLAEAEAAEPEPVDPPTVITMAPEKTLLEQILDTLVANTYALLGLVVLVILMLVVVLLRRNRAAEQEAALAGMEGMPIEEAGVEDESGEQKTAVKEDDAPLSADVSDDEFEEIMSLAGSADAALMSHDDEDVDSEDQPADDDFDIAAESVGTFAPEAAEEEQTLVLDAFDEEAPEESPAAEGTDQDVLEEADALIAYERFDEAESLLRDAIVADPDRVDLRMKLLEAYVGKQDAVGFKLQETEIRDMGVSGVEPRIATLRAQLHDETDSEILEEGEDDFFNELNALDDMEVALDLEASAEVDDDKVLSGAVAEEEAVQQEPTADVDSNDIDFNFDFAPDEDASGDIVDDDAADPDDGIELSISVPEQATEERLPGEDDEIEGLSLSADFDLSDTAGDADVPATEDAAIEDIESISFDLQDDEVESAPAKTASTSEAAEHHDENAIDFDFDFSLDEPEPAVPESSEASVMDSDGKSESVDNDIDFDFAVIDEEQPADNIAETALVPESAESDAGIESADDDIEFDLDLDADAEPEDSSASVEFDLDSDDDAEIEFLDEDDEEHDDGKTEFSFDDDSFDLSPDADAATDQKQDATDSFDDLQFVDDNLEQAGRSAQDVDAEDDEDLDFLSDTDEAATKLDLARAYFEMGDTAGAREILEEVIKEGNDEQVKDANELLGKL